LVFFAFVVTFWSANAGIKALFDGLNVAYGEAEKRSFIRLNMVSFAITNNITLFTEYLDVDPGAVGMDHRCWLRIRRG
jgi:membrane protein